MHKIDPGALSRKNLALLIVFDVVAEMRSVTLAAERLSLSQPALSHSLGKLRQLFDDPLFVRGRGMLMLTPRAEALVTPVRTLLASAVSILRPARPDPASFDRDLHLAMSDTCRLTMGRAVMRRVRERAPGLRLHVERFDEQSALRFAEGSLDLVLGENASVPRSLRSIEVRRDRLVGVVDAAHPLAPQARLNAVTLDAWIACPHAVVAMPGYLPDHVGAALATIGVRRPVGARLGSFLQALSSVVGTAMVAAVPERLVRAMQASNADIVSFDLPVKTAPVRQRLVWHPATDGDAELGWLRETVRAVALEGDATAEPLPTEPLSAMSRAAVSPETSWPIPLPGNPPPADRPHA